MSTSEALQGRTARPSWKRTKFAALERVGIDGLLVATVVVATIFSIIQWSTPNVVGIDGYFHIKLAAIMRDQGWGVLLPVPFPWLPTTILNPAEFTDHHLLYHLLLVPFTFLDLRIGAKLSAVIFASLALLIAYQIMAENRVRFAMIWLLVLIGSAGPFLYRLSMARRQAVTLTLLLLALYLAFSHRRRWLAPLGFAFVWLFDGFPLLLGVCIAAMIGDWWERRRVDWGLVIYPGLGVLLGVVIHPYFPNNIWFSYLHMLPKVAQIIGVSHSEDVIRVGNEWYPYSLDFLFRTNWLPLILVPLGFVPILMDPRLSRLRSLDGRVVTLAILALAYLALFLRSRRWIEAEPAFAVLFCAFSWSMALPDWFVRRLRRLVPERLAPVAFLAALVIVAPQVYLTVRGGISEVRGARDYTQYRDAARWLAQNTPAGSRVFATDWDDFPELFYWNSHNSYLVGLDPTYMYLHDGPLYLTWRAITRGQVENPSALIRDRFDSGYVFSDRNHTPFLRNAATDPDLVEVFRNNEAVVYRVRGWRGQASEDSGGTLAGSADHLREPPVEQPADLGMGTLAIVLVN